MKEKKKNNKNMDAYIEITFENFDNREQINHQLEFDLIDRSAV